MSRIAAAQAEATKAAQKAGIDHAKARTDITTYRGRKPSFTRAQFTQARDMLALKIGVSEIARRTGLSRQTIYRIEQDPAAQEAALAVWTAPKVKRVAA